VSQALFPTSIDRNNTAPGAAPPRVALSPIHDFAAKLRQPAVLPQLREYVAWQAAARDGRGDAAQVPDFAPVSINLDITTACNYACDHCVDMEILNTGTKYRHKALLASLEQMVAKGLRSVIVIGGGEPTIYPKFSETVRFMKSLGLQVAVVSNGSRMHKIAEIADCLDANDWVRLSLDAGSDAVFQAMHKPKQRITLDEICAAVPGIKEINPHFKLGFAFVITWKGSVIHDQQIVENLHEITMGAERAKRYGFDYIAFKPFLTRAAANNAEIVDLRDVDRHFDAVVARIGAAVAEAQKLEDDGFKVYKTTNLKVLESRTSADYHCQPRTCHMQFFRQVLSPLGMYNCPVYRNQPHGRIGDAESYATPERYAAVRGSTADLIQRFDASQQCQEVTCLYNPVNWWIEGLIAEPARLEEIAPSTGAPDYFL